MDKTLANRKFEGFFLLLILCISLFLSLYNLGNQYLWQDEAQTALISKTILTDGVPKGCDGRNSFSQELGQDFGKNNISKRLPWLPFYVLALFYKLFGISTFIARFPFALFGVGSVFLSYLLCRAMWENKKIAFAAAVLLAACVPFLLVCRQCRYSSMTAFFSLWALYSYIKIIDEKKNAYITFILSSMFLFHSNYIYCAPLFLAVLLHSLIFYRGKLLVILSLTLFIILINIPWIIWFYIPGHNGNNNFPFIINKFLKFNVEFVRQICLYIFSPYLLLTVPAAAIACRIKKQPVFLASPRYWKMLCLLLFFTVLTIAEISTIILAPFFRYLTPLIPILIIFAACLAVYTARIHFLAPIAIIVVLIITSPMKDFLYELTHDYDGPIKGIVKYLNANASQDDIVAITYGDMPLKFYTKLRIIGGLTGDDLTDAKKAQWVIVRKHVISKKDIAVRNYLIDNLSSEYYEKIEINYPDISYENREEPATHHFRTVTNEDRVRIFHKIENVEK
jgi:4-amino-4-deoxy-L-arabinose transferase-like glycosyltransferase